MLVKGEVLKSEVYRTSEHKSQHFQAIWNEQSESPDIITDKPKVSYKFGVLKVSNLHRDAKHQRFRGGMATGLKADMEIKRISHKVADGRFIPETEEEKVWSSAMPLTWYDEGWNMSLRKEETPTGNEEKQARTIEELKRIANNPLYFLRTYFRKESLDALPQGRDAYLLLFTTCINMPHGFYPTFGNAAYLFGEYKLKVSIFANEGSVENLGYDLKMSDWNDFTISESKEEG
jgi:hypothetical protein